MVYCAQTEKGSSNECDILIGLIGIDSIVARHLICGRGLRNVDRSFGLGEEKPVKFDWTMGKVAMLEAVEANSVKSKE
jgi:hypothetical protein